MKIALIGATGNVGSAILAELLQRGHQVTALVRQAGRLPAQAGLKEAVADVLDPAQVAQAVRGQDAVISAYNPGWQHPDLYATFLRGAKAIADGVKQAGVKRLLVVGGAGSLYVAPGVQLVDTPEFAAHMPPFVIPGAKAARDELTRLRGEQELEWTFVSPAAGPFKIPRTGKYRVGGEEVLMAGAQPADVAREDLALAIVDEIEAPKHVRARFTVATA
jgi:putative NADH-flavin reductase